MSNANFYCVMNLIRIHPKVNTILTENKVIKTFFAIRKILEGGGVVDLVVRPPTNPKVSSLILDVSKVGI